VALTDAAKNLMLDELATVAVWFSLHDGDPGLTGANEITGGTPAYARQQGVWDSAAAGVLGLAGDETFDVPASADVTHFGVWSAVSAGTFYGGAELSAPESFTGQGTYTLDDTATITIT
jgi:hypothetical protein